MSSFQVSQPSSIWISIRSTCLTFLDFTILTTFGRQCTWLGCSLSRFNSSSLAPNVLYGYLFSNTLVLCSFLDLFIYIFIYGWFNDAVSRLNFIASNGRTINKWRIAMKQLWPTSRYYPGIRKAGLRKSTKSLVQIAGAPANIQTDHVQRRYSFTS
jgi:hypothetical protein